MRLSFRQRSEGREGVFVLVPPNFDPQPGFPEARAIGAALRSALETARPVPYPALEQMRAPGVQLLSSGVFPVSVSPEAYRRGKGNGW
jgi:hypothetical protein